MPNVSDVTLPIPAPLMGYLRVMRLTDDILIRTAGDELLREALKKNTPWTIDHEIEASEDLYKIVTRQMKDYPTTIKEDETLLTTLKICTESDTEDACNKKMNRRNAVVMRLGEKRILKAYITVLENYIGTLKSDEIQKRDRERTKKAGGSLKGPKKHRSEL